MRNFIILTVVALQAAAANAALNSPEATLFTQASIIAGQQYTDAERANLMSKIVLAYDQTAPQAGREDRMVSALEEMNIMTPARAEEFRASVDQAVSNKDRSEVETALASVLRSTSVGAQYSNCLRDYTFGGIAVVGAVASVVAYNHVDGVYQESAVMGALVFGGAAVWFLLETGNDCR